MKLWIVGTHEGETWRFDGIFTKKELAVANCVDENQFVCPIVPDLDITGKPGPSQIEHGWPGSFYPLKEG